MANALQTMGGGRDLRRLGAIAVTVQSTTYHQADGDHPDPPFLPDRMEAEVFDDYAHDARRQVQRVTTGTGQSVEVRSLVVGAAAQVASATNGVADPARGTAAAAAWELADPLRALRLAEVAPDLRAGPDQRFHGWPAHEVRFRFRGFPVSILLSSDTGLPLASERVVTAAAEIAWASRGDLNDRTEWSNWTMVTGVRWPFQADTFRNGRMLTSTSVKSARLDAPSPVEGEALDAAVLAQLEQPGRRDVDALPLGRPDRPIAEIATGVVQIPGSWYATIVRQPDGLVIIDAPISNGYSARVMAEARRRFPGVPIKAVVTTTSFHWHTAGLREYVAEGVPIYALDRNREVVRALLDAPHTLAPDQLARHPRRADLRLVSAPLVLGTGDNRLVLRPIRRATGQMMMVEFPRWKLLHTAEMVQPLGPGGALLFPESLQELTDAVADAEIAPETMIGMHMSPTPWSRVREALDAAKAGRPAPPI